MEGKKTTLINRRASSQWFIILFKWGFKKNILSELHEEEKMSPNTQKSKREETMQEKREIAIVDRYCPIALEPGPFIEEMPRNLQTVVASSALTESCAFT